MGEVNDQIVKNLTGPGGPFEVEEKVIHGVPTKIWKTAPKNLNEVFNSTRVHGEKTFLVYGNERYSYHEVHQQVLALQQSLTALGVRRGERVAIAMRNYPEWIVTFYAVVSMGAIAVPLNSWWTGPELNYGLYDSGSIVLVCDFERLERLAPYLSDIRTKNSRFKVIVTRSEDRDTESTVDGTPTLSFHTVVADVDPAAEVPESNIDPEEIAAIFYTSGTTGEPKGAAISHRNIISCLMNAFYSSTYRSLVAKETQSQPTPSGDDSKGGSPQNSVLLSVPLFHATGCFATLIPNSVAGSKITLMYKWDPTEALSIIERERITTFGGVPAMVWQVLNHPEFQNYDTSSVSGIGYGGAPSAPELVKKIKEYFPTSSPTNGYGLTETAAIVTLNVGDDYVRKPDSAGPAMPVMELKIVNSYGKSMSAGEVGELWIKGPTVISGYWNKEAATKASFQDGWLKTGDVAYLDDENFLHIVDRSKDVVIRGGENVYSVEVESAIFEHQGVADVAVVGLPDPVLGEEVCAVIETKPGHSLTEAEIQEHVAKRLAKFKVPTYVYFTDKELPRNAAGKVLKRELRDKVHKALAERIN